MTNAAANIIPTEWKSISLEAMNEKAAMQTRVDRKYIVDAETAAKVLSTLDADASVMEIKGQRDFAYDSVYFDTPQMQSYHSAAYSRDDTFKIRTRSYLDSELTFLEVKTDGEAGYDRQEAYPVHLREPRYAHRGRSRVHHRSTRRYPRGPRAQAGGGPDHRLPPYHGLPAAEREEPGRLPYDGGHQPDLDPHVREHPHGGCELR